VVQALADAREHRIRVFDVPGTRAVAEMQPVVLAPGNDVQMKVKDVLARGATGGMKQIHGLRVEGGPVVQGQLLRDGRDLSQ
jgi:hypothetical protein